MDDQRKRSFFATFFGNGGINTDYPAQNVPGMEKVGTFGSNGATGVDPGQMFLGLTYSRKLNEKHSFGVTGLLAYQYFEAKGLAAFGQMSSAPNQLTYNGHNGALGYGIKLGYLANITEKLSFGASYQTMQYVGEFNVYKGLFVKQSDFDIPSTWIVGLVYQLTNDWTFMADYKRINYSDAASVSNKMDPTQFQVSSLGTDKGAGFGWDDIRDSGKAIDLSLVYAPSSMVNGYNPMDFDPQQAIQGNVASNQNIDLS